MGVVLIIASLLIARLLGVAYLYRRGPVLDAMMCPVDGPAGLTVLLIDATDPITEIQRASVHNHFERIAREVPKQSAIEVFTVEQVGSELLHRTGERVCSPGRGGNPLFENPRMVETKWKEVFWQPLQTWEEQAVRRASSSTSPILESLQSLAVTEFQSPVLRDRPKKLVVVSDMLQNTSGLSQYRTIESFETVRLGDYFRSVHADLTGVTIEILYLVRSGTPQGKQHIEFWQKYFSAAGATLTMVTSV